MNSLSEHIILVFMLKLFVSVLEHLCIHDNVHFHIASSHVITQIEYLLVLFSMFASPNILNSKTNSMGEQNYIWVVYKSYKKPELGYDVTFGQQAQKWLWLYEFSSLLTESDLKFRLFQTFI